MLVKANINGDIVSVLIFDVTIGKEGRETPEYSGRIKKVEKSYFAEMQKEYFMNVLWLDNNIVIRSVADEQVMNKDGIKMKDCLERDVACTGGSIALSPKDGQMLYNLVYIAGKEDVSVKVGDGIIAPEFLKIMQKIESKPD